jgi:hypothetical protein
MGRAEDFTEVIFDAPQPEGVLIPARITGTANGQLTATPLHRSENIPGVRGQSPRRVAAAGGET